MKLPSVLYRLSEKFTPMTSDELRVLDADGNKWWQQIPTEEGVENTEVEYMDPIDKKTKKRKRTKKEVMQIKFKRFADEWYMRYVWAFSYIFLFRWITDWMNPREDRDTGKEE